MDGPLLTNDAEKVSRARHASECYLQTHPDLLKSVSKNVRAYGELLDLIPETVETVFSGHVFPFTESHSELENSYQLCLEAFYRYSASALRSVLELGLLGVYFSIDGRSHGDMQSWLDSDDPTPRFHEVLLGLQALPNLRAFDADFGLIARIRERFGGLSDFVHTRGMRYSSRGQCRANFNRFSPSALEAYCEMMFGVVTDVICVMLLRYPMGMQPAPISEKFGLNGPVGGFLEYPQVEIVTSVLDEDERAMLKSLSDGDAGVASTLEWLESLPDLTQEQWDDQMAQWEEMKAKQRHLPDEVVFGGEESGVTGPPPDDNNGPISEGPAGKT